jgi:hypothetical protein
MRPLIKVSLRLYKMYGLLIEKLIPEKFEETGET